MGGRTVGKDLCQKGHSTPKNYNSGCRSQCCCGSCIGGDRRQHSPSPGGTAAANAISSTAFAETTGNSATAFPCHPAGFDDMLGRLHGHLPPMVVPVPGALVQPLCSEANSSSKHNLASIQFCVSLLL